jgi:hypothetical protein
MRLELADDLEQTIQREHDLQIPVNWVTPSDAEARYLNRGFGNSYDFNQVA